MSWVPWRARLEPSAIKDRGMRMARSIACGHVPVCQLSGGARWQTHLHAHRLRKRPAAENCHQTHHHVAVPVNRRHSPRSCPHASWMASAASVPSLMAGGALPKHRCRRPQQRQCPWSRLEGCSGRSRTFKNHTVILRVRPPYQFTTVYSLNRCF